MKALHLEKVLLVVLLAAGCHRERGTPRPTPRPPATLRLVTWNVLADPVFTDLRVPALLRELEATRADVIALQEVAPWFLRELEAAPWVRGQYHLLRHEGQVIAPGGQLVFARFPFAGARVEVLPGPQRRTAVFVELRVQGRTLGVATSHLESFLEDGPIRARQLAILQAGVAAADDAVILGDLNFGDGEQPETAALEARYVDLWTALHPGKPGLTWDMPQNPLARIGAFKTEGSRRLDRILLRSTRWKPVAMKRLGERPAGRARWPGHAQDREQLLGDGSVKPGDVIDVHPSDHLGLLAEICYPPRGTSRP
jgi:endonuclease/exonuclease/phosphatase family metal-dependent hydrolase